MRAKPNLTTLSFLAASLLLGAAAASAKEKLVNWADTEVKWLLTDEERAAWGRLQADDERQAFVDDFWARRDPDPKTPGNEYRQAIEQRVKDANRQFRGEGRQGWSTERGRFYIIFGPPDEVREDAPGAVVDGAATQVGGGQTTHGRVTWTYRRVADHDLPPNTKLVFEADSSGAYRLTSKFDPQWVNFNAFIRPPGVKPVTGETALAEAGQAKAAAAAKRSEVDLLARLVKGESPGGGDLANRPLFFPTGGQVLVVVPFLVAEPAAASGPAELLAALFSASEDKVLHAESMTFERAEGEAGKVRSFAFLADPGAHRLGMILRSPAAEAAIASSMAVLEVPAFAPGEFALSSVLLARGVEMVDRPFRPYQVADRVVVGNIVLDASPGNRVGRESQPEAFFFVSGAKVDGGTMDVAATYRVLQGDKLVKATPPLAVGGTASAQPIPLAGVAPGSYDLEIQLEDKRGKTSATRKVPFIIE